MDGLADDPFLFGALDVIDVGKILHQRSSGLAMIDMLMGNSQIQRDVAQTVHQNVCC